MNQIDIQKQLKSLNLLHLSENLDDIMANRKDGLTIDASKW